MYLNKKIYKEIKEHALKDYPNECCGFILEKDSKTISYPSKNIAEKKSNNFMINPIDYIKISNMGRIVGLYHSHCQYDYNFSLLDKFTSSNHKIPFILYNVKIDKFDIYDKNDIYSDYIGIKFEYNKNDCFNLIEKFYKKELNIILDSYSRDDKWFDKVPNLIEDKIESLGFRTIEHNNFDLNYLKYGDLIIVNEPFSKKPKHLMLYIGSNQILHSTSVNKYSLVEQYNNIYKKLTNKVMRHKNLCNI